MIRRLLAVVVLSCSIAALAASPASSMRVPPWVPWPWNAVMDCESGDADGRPPYTVSPTVDADFDGAVQFHPSTWRSARRLVPGAWRYAYAYQAPLEVQLAVAQRWLALTSWRQWPDCSRRLGLR